MFYWIFFPRCNIESNHFWGWIITCNLPQLNVYGLTWLTASYLLLCLRPGFMSWGEGGLTNNNMCDREWHPTQGQQTRSTLTLYAQYCSKWLISEPQMTVDPLIYFLKTDNTRSLVYKQPKKIMTSLCCLKFCQISLVRLLICCLNMIRSKCFGSINFSYSLEN